MEQLLKRQQATLSDLSAKLSGFYDIADVMKFTTLGRTEIFKKVKNGTFPRPIPISGRRKAWPVETVEEWKRAVVKAAEGRAA